MVSLKKILSKVTDNLTFLNECGYYEDITDQCTHYTNCSSKWMFYNRKTQHLIGYVSYSNAMNQAKILTLPSFVPTFSQASLVAGVASNTSTATIVAQPVYAQNTRDLVIYYSSNAAYAFDSVINLRIK